MNTIRDSKGPLKNCGEEGLAWGHAGHDTDRDREVKGVEHGKVQYKICYS